ncbi:hypothetical protein NLG97_g8982 [Lecanicillium saksenae]|uniref:Uncharacterized protein n=1 Tax=Lecanicillium saksenae TaxID=468837 RepID=A0ACC1QKP0_9HYPO|nr:hypothetical protein NLG97_g8982 [Lecanicillium saksenae]
MRQLHASFACTNQPPTASGQAAEGLSQRENCAEAGAEQQSTENQADRRERARKAIGSLKARRLRRKAEEENHSEARSIDINEILRSRPPKPGHHKNGWRPRKPYDTNRAEDDRKALDELNVERLRYLSNYFAKARPGNVVGPQDNLL